MKNDNKRLAVKHHICDGCGELKLTVNFHGVATFCAACAAAAEKEMAE